MNKEIIKTPVKILIVDDSQNWRDVFKELLIDKDFEVFPPAKTIKEAKEILQRETIKLVILDIQLKKNTMDFSSVSLLEFVKHNCNEDSPSIIVIGYNFQIGDMERCKKRYPHLKALISKASPKIGEIESVKKLIRTCASRNDIGNLDPDWYRINFSINI